MAASVQLVLCMDTEGPCVDPSRPDLLPFWNLVDGAMRKLFDPGFRRRHPDSTGGHLRIGWFFLTWTGFSTNPRGRAFGYHAVRDHYLETWGDRLAETGDEQCWHYHHPAASGIGNEWGLDWNTCPEYESIISRQALDRAWFPVCYRAGGTIMDPVSSRWIDAWFPFDYSNRAPVKVDGLVDWSTGVRNWSVYHPAPEDFRRPGRGRRRMARSLDLSTWIYSLTDEEIVAAFERAAWGEPAVVSCFDHDYRDIAARVDELRARVGRIAAAYPSVVWQYAGPAEAVRRYLNAPGGSPLALDATVEGNAIHVRSSAPLYQSIPWVAARLADGVVRHVEDHVERIDERHWRWTPPGDVDWTDAAFAGSTDLGASDVVHVHQDRRLRVTIARSVAEDPERPRSIWHHSALFLELCAGRASGRLPETDSVAQAVELLETRLQPTMRVLDAACAAGHAWRSLARFGIEYHGVDSCERAIDIGRHHLARTGLEADRLRALRLEDLPRGERYDAVICLNALSYFPMYHEPLEVLANAANRWLVIRSSFADRMEVRYLPDVLLEPGFQDLRAYFNVFARDEVAAFLAAEGFRVRWIADRRQLQRFVGQPEVVGGIALPAEFLFAERVSPRPSEEERLRSHFGPLAIAWRERREGGPQG